MSAWITSPRVRATRSELIAARQNLNRVQEKEKYINMKNTNRIRCLLAGLVITGLVATKTQAQDSPAATTAAADIASSAATGSVVPRLIAFSGIIKDAAARVPAGNITLTFSLYEGQDGGSPLWSETQQVQPDAQGHYTVMLGATQPAGLPIDLFTSGQARWLGVLAGLPGVGELPRVLLVGVPYALKAADAETLGGRPASAYVTTESGQPSGVSSLSQAANSASAAGSSKSVADSAKGSASSDASTASITGSGTTNFVPLWTSSTSLGNSVLFQKGGEVGVGTQSPGALLDVEGTSNSSILNLKQSGNGQALTVTSTTSGNTAATFTSPSAGAVVQVNNTNTFDEGFAASFSAKGDTAVVQVTQSGNGVGLQGTTHSATDAVLGEAVSSLGGTGVAGTTNSSAVGAVGVSGVALPSSGPTLGVSGSSVSAGGTGVKGTSSASSNVGLGFSAAGTWGDSGEAGTAGVLGTEDNGHGLVAVNNSATFSTILGENRSTSTSATLLILDSPFIPGQPGCTVFANGNFVCSGSKSAVVPVDDGTRKVALYAVESPENWFDDYGSGQLANGAATIKLDPTYIQTVNTAMEYHVFLTAKGDCSGLYVTNEGPAGFEVHELHGGQSNVAFDYRIVARRKGYESIRLADLTEQMKPPVLKPSEKRP
jgi:hypothetical protein